MKEYKVFEVRFPLDARTRMEDVSDHTGIQKVMLPRSVILKCIEKEHDTRSDANLDGLDQAVLQNTSIRRD